MYGYKPYCAGVPWEVIRSPPPNNTPFYRTNEYEHCIQPNSSALVWRYFYNTCDPEKEDGCINLFPGRKMVKEVSNLHTAKKIVTMPYTQYMRFLMTCDPVSDDQCPGWVIDGKPVKEISEYHPLYTTSSKKDQNPCHLFLYKANPALEIPDDFQQDSWESISSLLSPSWVETGFAVSECTLRFAIPPENTSAVPSVSVVISTSVPS